MCGCNLIYSTLGYSTYYIIMDTSHYHHDDGVIHCYVTAFLGSVCAPESVLFKSQRSSLIWTNGSMKVCET